MDESFKLQTTMSPKPQRTIVHVKKPTVLALRKNIRRSSCYSKPPAAVAEIDRKGENIQNLVDKSSDIEYETAESNFDSSAMFADLSIVPKDTTMKAMNSTFIEGRCTQFHELFHGYIKKTKSPKAKAAHRNNDKLEIPKVLDGTYGTLLSKRENEVPHCHPKKKISTKINEIHKAVCETNIKKKERENTWQKGGGQHNLLSSDSKKLISKPLDLNHSPPNHKNGRKLYFVESGSDSEDEIFKEKKFTRIVKPKVIKDSSVGNCTDIRQRVQIIKDNSNKSEKKYCFVESESEDELFSKTELKSFKTEDTETRNIVIIKDNDRKLDNSSTKISSTKSKVNNSRNKPIVDPKIVLISDTDDEECTIDVISKRIQTPKPLMEYSNNVLTNVERKKNKPLETGNEGRSQENDNLDEVRKVLDEIYGSSWREKENVILRTEPRQQVTAKMDFSYKALSNTDVKKIDFIKKNDNNKPNLHCNHLTTKNTYIESPLLKFPTTTRHADRRRLFPSVDSEDEDFRKDTGLLANLKNIPFQRESINAKALEPAPSKSVFVKKRDTHKESWLKNLCDSDSESVESVVSGELSNDSDWESPQEDYLPKYIKPTEAKSSTLKKPKTFLESLSKNVPIFESHPTARIFRNNFKKHKDELTTRLFKLFNEEVFAGVIPGDTCIDWNSRLRGTAGYCKNRKITHPNKNVTRTVAISLSNKVLDSPDRLRDTLIHEMCHAANWIVDGQRGHGPSWRNWTIKAMNVFPELPPITTCHNYNITTKYTYRCTKCGYSFGRHSKSIAIEKKCCGYCKGMFELLVNKVSKSGSTNSIPVPATPTRKANAFALFVKDNYKTCKTPDNKHGDVMRLLSKQFASLKVDRRNNS